MCSLHSPFSRRAPVVCFRPVYIQNWYIRDGLDRIMNVVSPSTGSSSPIDGPRACHPRRTPRCPLAGGTGPGFCVCRAAETQTSVTGAVADNLTGSRCVPIGGAPCARPVWHTVRHPSAASTTAHTVWNLVASRAKETWCASLVARHTFCKGPFKAFTPATLLRDRTHHQQRPVWGARPPQRRCSDAAGPSHRWNRLRESLPLPRLNNQPAVATGDTRDDESYVVAVETNDPATRSAKGQTRKWFVRCPTPRIASSKRVPMARPRRTIGPQKSSLQARPWCRTNCVNCGPWRARWEARATTTASNPHLWVALI